MDSKVAGYVAKLRDVLKEIESLPLEQRREKLLQWREPFPQHLYHYRGYDGANDARNLQDMLVESQLFLRAPKDFNDPFECRFQFGKLGSTMEVYDYLISAAASQGESLAVNPYIAAGMIGKGRDGIEKDAINDTNRRLQEVGIYCLTETYKNILMWSHYGQSHRGVCIEFDVARGVKTFGLSRKVRYDGPMPTLDYPDSTPHAILSPIFRKSGEWGYEEEWRIAIPSGSHQHIDFPPGAVTAVIFGCAATDDARKVVDGLLEERAKKGLPDVAQRHLKRADRQYIVQDDP